MSTKWLSGWTFALLLWGALAVAPAASSPQVTASPTPAKALGAGVSGAALASDDVTPPVLTSLSVTPTSVDVSSGPATVTATATITDDLSGFSQGAIYFESPSGNQLTYAGDPSFHLLAGDQYAATVTFLQYAETGTWHVYGMRLSDNAGNNRFLYRSDLQALGLDPTVTVTGIADTTAPILSSLSVTPTSVDVSSGSKTVTATATITDDLSGFSQGAIYFESPSGTQHTFGADVSFQPLGGDQYTETVTFPQFAEAGTWHVYYVRLIDNAGNNRYLYLSDLQALGLNPTVTVTGIADTTAPILSSLSVTPTSVDVSSSRATVSATATITDDLSGFSTGSIYFESPSGNQHTFGADASFQPLGGDQYAATVTFLQFAEAGTWHVYYVWLIDNAGNSRYLNRSDLQALGFDPTVVVVIDTTPPVVTAPTQILANATGPTGVHVPFTVTATDDVDGPVPATCTPTSGSLFPIGNTTVTCSASDTAGNTGTASFAVQVKGASEQLVDLGKAVKGVGPGTSLADKVSTAQAALARGDVAGTCEILNAFINQVKALSGRGILVATANTLMAEAARIRAVLGC